MVGFIMITLLLGTMLIAFVCDADIAFCVIIYDRTERTCVKQNERKTTTTTTTIIWRQQPCRHLPRRQASSSWQQLLYWYWKSSYGLCLVTIRDYGKIFARSWLLLASIQSSFLRVACYGCFYLHIHHDAYLFLDVGVLIIWPFFFFCYTHTVVIVNMRVCTCTYCRRASTLLLLDYCS